jgi:hypothetical protein
MPQSRHAFYLQRHKDSDSTFHQLPTRCYLPSSSESVWVILSSSTVRSSLGVQETTCEHDKCRSPDSIGAVGVFVDVFMVSGKLPMYTGARMCP